MTDLCEAENTAGGIFNTRHKAQILGSMKYPKISLSQLKDCSLCYSYDRHTKFLQVIVQSSLVLLLLRTLIILD